MPLTENSCDLNSLKLEGKKIVYQTTLTFRHWKNYAFGAFVIRANNVMERAIIILTTRVNDFSVIVL